MAGKVSAASDSDPEVDMPAAPLNQRSKEVAPTSRSRMK
eukprot:CAMPEP_0182589566 /NCGR_PEP_ID=MMETSP1324-20130603/69820_1 /TAXON_ID=236786 /ORGANISM="Florenciella sp., Strain RCC1587" /LENGTH=38 /DNA_ID= /DNA_START= /DNA_END= /DNA_ORIENTATION=